MTASLTRDTVAVNDEHRIRTIAYIGLGSNLGDREGALRQALAALDAQAGIDVAAVSTLRETEPVGYVDQPRFLNGAAAWRPSSRPASSWRRCSGWSRSSAATARRARDRFGPRTIDLDLLLYGELELDEEGLTVPHPRLHERRFVLEPLDELAPGLFVPGRGRVSDLLAKLD